MGSGSKAGPVLGGRFSGSLSGSSRSVLAMSELVQYERDGRIVVLRLNRPEKLNAFSDEMVMALGEQMRRFDADPEAHVGVLCGGGRAFSSGADVA